MSDIKVLDMAVLPGAIVGELLEQLNVARRRVVLDGFEPHADEWAGRWPGGRGPAGAPSGGEAEVLERVADEMTADRPGQPTAAEVVLAVTMAIRRDPEKAAVIVDAMLVDHPRMAVVIVATALRVSPGQRKQILAQARRHKPFSRHPFLLGILLVFVAKALGDQSADAAEVFVDAHTPADIVAALGRLRAARADADGERASDAARAAGAAPYLAPAFLATVLAAGEAWSKTIAPEAVQSPLSSGGSSRGRPVAADEEASFATGNGISRIDGDPSVELPEALSSRALAPERLPAHPADSEAAPERLSPAVESAAGHARAMLAPGAAANGVQAGDAASGAGPVAEDAEAAEDAAVALVEQLLLKLDTHTAAGLDASTLLADLTGRLAALLQGRANEPGAASDLPAGWDADGEALQTGPASDAAGDEGRPEGADPHPAAAPRVFALWPDDDLPTGPQVVPAQGSPDLSLDFGIVIGSPAGGPLPGAPMAIDPPMVIDPSDEPIGMQVVIDGDSGPPAVEVEAQGLAPGVAEMAVAAHLALLDEEDGLLDTSLQASAVILDSVEADAAVGLAIGGEDGFAAADIAASADLAGVAEATVAAGLTLLPEDAVLDAAAQASAAIADFVDAAIASDVAIGGEGGLAEAGIAISAGAADLAQATAGAEVGLLAEGGAVDASVQASAAAADIADADFASDVVIGGEGGLAEAGIAISAGTADLAEATAGTEVGLLAEGGAVDVSAQASAAIPDIVDADVAAQLTAGGPDGPAAAQVETSVAVPGIVEAGAAADLALLDDEAAPNLDVQTQVEVPAVATVEAAIGGDGDGMEVAGSVAIDPLLSVEIAAGGGDGLEVEIDLLPSAPPVPVVEDVVETVETLVVGLLGAPPAETAPEPPSAPPPPPVQSVLYTLGGLFG